MDQLALVSARLTKKMTGFVGTGSRSPEDAPSTSRPPPSLGAGAVRSEAAGDADAFGAQPGRDGCLSFDRARASVGARVRGAHDEQDDAGRCEHAAGDVAHHRASEGAALGVLSGLRVR